MSKGNRRKDSGAGIKASLFRTFRNIFLITVVVCGVVLAVKGMRWLRRSPMFRVAQVHVVGNERVLTSEILAYAAVKQGDPIFELGLDAVATRVRSHPWIREVTIRRRLPDRITVNVVEHKPALLVALDDLYVANEMGQPFKLFAVRDGLVLPVLTGLAREQAIRDPDKAVERIRQGIALAAGFARYESVLGRLEEMHFDEAMGWSTVARAGSGSAPLRVYLGQTPLERLDVAQQAMELMSSGSTSMRVPEVIWANGVKHPDMVHVQFAGGHEHG